ncbi:MAG: glycosyltransferase family 4 protein [Verrucomicrobia bacterium]|nr:glycosyltransferase family 4 protein [Verrucomicrobiota bacterium]
MKALYLYNEILPTCRAHDTYVVNNCASLAQEGLDIELLIGKGSCDLSSHYATPPLDARHLPILRRNNFLNLSWNRPFFRAAQKAIEKLQPDLVFSSVRKQGAYHHQRKWRKTRYIFEVHELVWWPGKDPSPHFNFERKMLERADLITTTTQPLAELLRAPPYSLPNPIEVVPLAVQAQPLPPPQPHETLRICYVGQLYPLMGVELLLDAHQLTSRIDLHIVGGSTADIARLIATGAKNVYFHGFMPPRDLPRLLSQMDCFVMPSKKIEAWRPFAHTKLYEYCSWGRPVIAPSSPVVEEHLGTLDGVLLYESSNPHSLAEVMMQLQSDTLRQQLTEAQLKRGAPFTWEKRAKKLLHILGRFF